MAVITPLVPLVLILKLIRWKPNLSFMLSEIQYSFDISIINMGMNMKNKFDKYMGISRK